MNKTISPETKKISIPIGGLFIVAFITAKILHDISPSNVIVNDVGQAIRHYLPVLERRYNYSLEAFGFSSANWQATYMAGIILVCVVSLFYSLLVRFSRPELLMMYARYAPKKRRAAVALILISTIIASLFFSVVFYAWMPALISEPRLHGPLYRVVPDGVSWSNGWDAVLFYIVSQTGVFIRGLLVIMRPPQ